MLAAVVACGAAWAAAVPRHSPAGTRRRLDLVLPRPGGPGRGADRWRATWSPRLVGACGIAVAFVAMVGGPTGVVLGVVGGGGAWVVLGRLESASARRARRQVVRDLPFAADLLATCLAAGAAPVGAFDVVGDVVGGPLGRAFARAAAALALGASASEAVGGWQSDPALRPLAPIARLVVRASESGTAIAAPAERVAADLRDARRWRVDEVARRAGVRATAPLGACFLPAFALLGIVPVVLWGSRSLGA